MPFKSIAQQKYLFAKKPKIAKEFASKTSDYSSLPERVSKKKKKKKKDYMSMRTSYQSHE